MTLGTRDRRGHPGQKEIEGPLDCQGYQDSKGHLDPEGHQDPRAQEGQEVVLVPLVRRVSQVHLVCQGETDSQAPKDLKAHRDLEDRLEQKVQTVHVGQLAPLALLDHLGCQGYLVRL